MLYLHPQNTVVVAQLVRASDCGSEGHGFEPRLPPEKSLQNFCRLFLFYRAKLVKYFTKELLLLQSVVHLENKMQVAYF